MGGVLLAGVRARGIDGGVVESLMEREGEGETFRICNVICDFILLIRAFKRARAPFPIGLDAPPGGGEKVVKLGSLVPPL